MSQPVNVTVVNRGCGSGCASTIGFVFLIVLVLALVGAFIKYWYVTVPIAAVLITLGIFGAMEARRKSATQQAKQKVIDVNSDRVTSQTTVDEQPDKVPLAPGPPPVQPQVSAIQPPPPPPISEAPPPPVIEPGWKSDPSDPSHIAYWDGMQYSAHKKWNGSEWADV